MWQVGPRLMENSGASEQLEHMRIERLILVDSNDQKIGEDTKENCHRRAVLDSHLHRSFSVFLFDDESRLLLQKRSEYKITYPLRWTNTCCSHPLAFPQEEEPAAGILVAAARKLRHELGLKPADYRNLQFVTRFQFKSHSDAEWGENEIIHILVGFVPKSLQADFNANEVAAVRFVTHEELQSEVANDQAAFTPWFRSILRTFLPKIWSNLGSLGSVRSDKITNVGFIDPDHGEGHLLSSQIS